MIGLRGAMPPFPSTGARQVRAWPTCRLSPRPETHLHPHEWLKRATLAGRHLKFLDTHLTRWRFERAGQVYNDFQSLWDYDLSTVNGMWLSFLKLAAGAQDAPLTPLAHTGTHRVPCGPRFETVACVLPSRAYGAVIRTLGGPLAAPLYRDFACVRALGEILCYGVDELINRTCMGRSECCFSDSFFRIRCSRMLYHTSTMHRGVKAEVRSGRWGACLASSSWGDVPPSPLPCSWSHRRYLGVFMSPCTHNPYILWINHKKYGPLE